MTETASIARLRFPDTATVRQAEDVQKTLALAIARHAGVVVDCSGLKEADLSAVQLLLAAHRSAAAQGKRFALAAPASDALLGVLVRAGILDPDAPAGSPDADFWLKGAHQP